MIASLSFLLLLCYWNIEVCESDIVMCVSCHVGHTTSKQSASHPVNWCKRWRSTFPTWKWLTSQTRGKPLVSHQTDISVMCSGYQNLKLNWEGVGAGRGGGFYVSSHFKFEKLCTPCFIICQVVFLPSANHGFVYTLVCACVHTYIYNTIYINTYAYAL